MNETQSRSEAEPSSTLMSVLGSDGKAFKEEKHSMDVALEMITPECPKCGSHKGQWRGYRELAKSTASVHRRWCSMCGHWTSHKTTMR